MRMWKCTATDTLKVSKFKLRLRFRNMRWVVMIYCVWFRIVRHGSNKHTIVPVSSLNTVNGCFWNHSLYTIQCTLFTDHHCIWMSVCIVCSHYAVLSKFPQWKENKFQFKCLRRKDYYLFELLTTPHWGHNLWRLQAKMLDNHCVKLKTNNYDILNTALLFACTK